MKIKIVPLVSAVIMLSLALFSNVSAQNIGSVNVEAKADIELKTQGNATSASAKTVVRGNATSAAAKSDHVGGAEANGELTAGTHRSTVASFIESLLNVANREGGIGAEVRLIAQVQNESASTSVNAIAKIENRAKIQTFLFGSDYKNLGELRSEIVTTKNNIDKLKRLSDKATSDVDKAELAAQIKVLEDSQVKIEAFIKAHEDSFSVFGWFVRLFVK